MRGPCLWLPLSSVPFFVTRPKYSGDSTFLMQIPCAPRLRAKEALAYFGRRTHDFMKASPQKRVRKVFQLLGETRSKCTPVNLTLRTQSSTVMVVTLQASRHNTPIEVTRFRQSNCCFFFVVLVTHCDQSILRCFCSFYRMLIVPPCRMKLSDCISGSYGKPVTFSRFGKIDGHVLE